VDDYQTTHGGKRGRNCKIGCETEGGRKISTVEDVLSENWEGDVARVSLAGALISWGIVPRKDGKEGIKRWGNVVVAWSKRK